MGSDSSEEQKMGASKRQRISKRVAASPKHVAEAQQHTVDTLTQLVNGETTAAQASESLADLLSSEAQASPIPGDASNAIDATPEQLGEVEVASGETVRASRKMTASEQAATQAASNAAHAAGDDPAQHVNGAATPDAAEHTAKVRAAGLNAMIRSNIDTSFEGRVQGISPDLARVLVTVTAPGLSPHRINKNVWLPISSVDLLSDAAQQHSNKRASRRSARSNSNTSNTDPSATSTSTTQEEDPTMAAKKSTKKSTKAASTKGAKNTSTKGASTGAASNKHATRGVLSKEAIDALPQALRAGVEATRLNWATEKFAKPKTLKFAAGASAGGYKAVGQIWGHIDVADSEFNKFWRFHFQQKGDKYIVNRTLSYDSAEAAQNAAKYEATNLGVANPEHFTFKF